MIVKAKNELHKRNTGLLSSLPLLTTGVLVSLLSACASMDNIMGGEAEQAPAAMEAKVEKSLSKAEVSVAEDVKSAQAAQQAAEEQVQKSADADAMMASLKAPVEAPPEAEELKEDVSAAAQQVETKQAAVAAKVEAAEVEKQAAEKALSEARSQTTEQTVTKVVAKNTVNPLNISEKDLPYNYDIWWIRNGDTPLTQGLVISTPTWEMGKEGYMSQIWLTLKEEEIHINSSSDIATKAKGLGIRIDDGELIPFTRVAENNIGIVEGEWLDQLSSAKKLDIYLGFFPGKKPLSDTFKSFTALDNLDRVVATYRKLKN